jgi:hypothetical protein
VTPHEIIVEVKNTRMLSKGDFDRADRICDGIRDLSSRLAAVEKERDAMREALRDCSLVLCETHGIAYRAGDVCARCQRDAR